MPTTPTIRCAHCLAEIPGIEALEVGSDLVCTTCAHLAGAVLPADGPTFDPAAEPSPHLPPGDARGPVAPGEADAELVARMVCRDVGVPLGDPIAEVEIEEDDDRPLLRRLLDDVDRWCEGRWWIPRLPILVFFAYVWVRHANDPMYQSLFKGLNLGIHELGHYVFVPFGDMMSALGGSLLQCLAPLAGMTMFLRQRDYFAIAFAFGWLSTNYFELATYVGDAVRKSLPLVTPGGGEPIHDWNYILGNYGWLRHTETLAGLHELAGHLCMVICLALGGVLLAKMMRSAVARHGAGPSPLR